MAIISSPSDIGLKKEVNQDALMVKQATTGGKEIIFAAVCDGMGGLANGELASSHMIVMLSYWFDKILPRLLKEGLSNSLLRESLNKVILKANESIEKIREEDGPCGTTVAALFLYAGHYASVNVGDSRIYSVTRNLGLTQITRDHSLVQNLIDTGKISEESARTHPQRNVLLQCVGAGAEVVPEYDFDYYQQGDVFILCSDGFRHKVNEEEMETALHPAKIPDKAALDQILMDLVELNKQRNETDNISAIAIKIEEGAL